MHEPPVDEWGHPLVARFVPAAAMLGGLAWTVWLEPPPGLVGHFLALPWSHWPLEAAIFVLAWGFWSGAVVMALHLVCGLIVMAALSVVLLQGKMRGR